MQIELSAPRHLSTFNGFLGLARGLIACMLVLSLLLPLGGCKRQRIGLAVPVNGYEPTGLATALDITNTNGSVLVVVDSKRFTKPEVWIKVLSDVKEPKEKRRVTPDWVTADSTLEGGRPVLRVNADPPVGAPQNYRAQILVRVPACENVTVRGSGGPIELRGVAGVINVQSGFENRPGGRIDLRTNAAITSPVLLSSIEGDVICQIGPASTGNVELSSDNGTVEVDARHASFVNVVPDRARWTGTMNGGTNPIVIRTSKGIARLYCNENAAEYRAPRNNEVGSWGW